VIGVPLVRLLVADGHTVAGLTRAQPDVVAALGAQAITGDVFDANGLARAVSDFAPDVVINQLTDLPDDFAQIAPEPNRRIRTEGNANLIAAANGARYLAQSVAWELTGAAGAAVRELERTTLEAGGVVLRYGQFYGIGTYYEDEPPPHPRIHVDDAARRTVEALEAPSGVIVVVDSPDGSLNRSEDRSRAAGRERRRQDRRDA
jgi:nucleoside-diphosphate-sugar epimerase